MTEPAPAWPHMPHAPDAPPAPVAPPPPPPLPAGFTIPTDAASMLDVSVPLAPALPDAAPHYQPALAVAAPPMPAMPAPSAPVQPSEAPAAPAGGVAAASPDDLVELRDPRELREAHAERDSDSSTAPPLPTGAAAGIWAPSVALVAAMFALAWQLVSYYAASVLPHRVAAGVTLDHYDTIVRGLPLVDGVAGGIVGTVLGIGTLALLLLGVRRGMREPVLQGAVALLASIAAAGTVLLPRLAA